MIFYVFPTQSSLQSFYFSHLWRHRGMGEQEAGSSWCLVVDGSQYELKQQKWYCYRHSGAAGDRFSHSFLSGIVRTTALYRHLTFIMFNLTWCAAIVLSE